MKIKIINSLAAAALLTGSLGVLQAEEAKSTDAKPAKAKAAKKSDRPSREAVIKRFDKDGDGKLNEAERKAAAALRKAQGARQSDRASDKARPNSGGRERYAAAAMKIKEAVKAGKITEAQGKERLAAYRKRMGEGRGDSGRSRQTREELMKRYDKNKDGKLDEDERAALRKAMSDRNSGSRSRSQDKNAERKRRGQGDEKNAKRKRPGQGNKKNAERKPRGGDRGKGGEGKRQGKRREKK
jgi:Ca2+-binding EF-hand superfamily protein